MSWQYIRAHDEMACSAGIEPTQNGTICAPSIGTVGLSADPPRGSHYI